MRDAQRAAKTPVDCGEGVGVVVTIVLSKKQGVLLSVQSQEWKYLTAVTGNCHLHEALRNSAPTLSFSLSLSLSLFLSLSLPLALSRALPPSAWRLLFASPRSGPAHPKSLLGAPEPWSGSHPAVPGPRMNESELTVRFHFGSSSRVVLRDIKRQSQRLRKADGTAFGSPENRISLGSRGDSFYEYLLKDSLFSGQEADP